MKRKTKKIILFSILTLFCFSIGFGFYLYNKGPVDVKNSRGYKVDAIELYQLYSSDSLKANKKFTSKILSVTGQVNEVTLNSNQQQVILIKTASGGAYINCTMEEPVENIKAQQQVTIKGICSGIGQGDAELGIPGDVYLTRCFIQTDK